MSWAFVVENRKKSNNVPIHPSQWFIQFQSVWARIAYMHYWWRWTIISQQWIWEHIVFSNTLWFAIELSLQIAFSLFISVEKEEPWVIHRDAVIQCNGLVVAPILTLLNWSATAWLNHSEYNSLKKHSCSLLPGILASLNRDVRKRW